MPLNKRVGSRLPSRRKKTYPALPLSCLPLRYISPSFFSSLRHYSTWISEQFLELFNLSSNGSYATFICSNCPNWFFSTSIVGHVWIFFIFSNNSLTYKYYMVLLDYVNRKPREMPCLCRTIRRQHSRNVPQYRAAAKTTEFTKGPRR